MHRGDRVTKMTRKVGQSAPTGTIVALKGASVEVRWDDGRTSLISRSGIVSKQKG